MRGRQGRFREGELNRASLLAAARGAGFDRAGVVDGAALARWSEGVARRAPPWMEREWIRSHLDRAGPRTVLVCALSCAPAGPDDLSRPGDPHALVAPFARRNYYAAAVRMMHALLRPVAAQGGFSPKAARILVNSPVPEKPLVAASGIGAYGKNGLTLVPGLGSLFVIAACVLPIPVEAAGGAPVEADFTWCGSCTRCIEACPVGAIVSPGVVDPDLCLQGLAERPVALAPAVMEKWGRRLYGCQDCQSACPHNEGRAPSTVECPGEIGPSVSIRGVLAAGIEGARGLFRGTPMGARRIDPAALVRNALIAAGNSGETSLRGEVQAWRAGPHPVLRQAAQWALARLG